VINDLDRLRADRERRLKDRESTPFSSGEWAHMPDLRTDSWYFCLLEMEIGVYPERCFIV
jgi:hypothetical protein